MKKIFLGIILGIGVVIPGVCTASLAIILGLYEIIISFFSGEITKKIVREIILIVIGFVIGVLTIILIINNLNEVYRYKLSVFFYGFMIYGFIFFGKEKIKIDFNLIYFIYGYIIIILFQLIFSFLKINFNESFTGLFIVGLLAGAALILPGLSGSVILVSFGVYYPLIETTSKILKSFKILKTLKIDYSLFLLMAFGFGLIIGVIILSILIKKLINQNTTKFNNFIFGMMSGTIFIMSFSLIEKIQFGSIILFFLGYFINKYFSNFNV